MAAVARVYSTQTVSNGVSSGAEDEDVEMGERIIVPKSSI